MGPSVNLLLMAKVGMGLWMLLFQNPPPLTFQANGARTWTLSISQQTNFWPSCGLSLLKHSKWGGGGGKTKAISKTKVSMNPGSECSRDFVSPYAPCFFFLNRISDALIKWFTHEFNSCASYLVLVPPSEFRQPRLELLAMPIVAQLTCPRLQWKAYTPLPPRKLTDWLNTFWLSCWIISCLICSIYISLYLNIWKIIPIY